jgi:integrase
MNELPKTIECGALPKGLYRPSYKDLKTGEVKESAVIWCRYYRNGKKVRVSTETDNPKEAERFRYRCVGGKRVVTTALQRTRFEDLAKLVCEDYEITGHRSLKRIKQAFAHLRAFFDSDLARDIGTDRINKYIKFRRDEHAGNATINRELCALRRSFKLAAQSDPPKVDHVPPFPRLKEPSARKGFFEREQLDAILPLLPEYLRAPMFTAFVTGWRCASEVLTRKRSHLNLQAGVLRLDPNETKTGEPREFAVRLVPELCEVLERQLATTRALEVQTGTVIPWLFHHNGKPIKSYERAWHAARQKAGLANRLVHDFRRTSARNLIRGGVPTSIAKQVTGHKTDSVFERYGIVDKSMRDDAVAKLAAVLESDRQKPVKVASLS